MTRQRRHGLARLNRRCKLLILALALFAVLPGSAIDALAASYYVSPAGSDSADGSQGDPWRTISHAMSSVNYGDSVLLTTGVWAEHVEPSPGLGTGPVTLAAAPGETPELQLTNQGPILDLIPGHTLVLRGLTMTNPAGNISEFLLIPGGNVVSVSNCDMDYNGANGFPIHISGTSGPGLPTTFSVKSTSISGAPRAAMRLSMGAGGGTTSVDGLTLDDSGFLAVIFNNTVLTVANSTTTNGTAGAWFDLREGTYTLNLQNNDFHLDETCRSVIATASEPSAIVSSDNRLHRDPATMTQPEEWDQLWSSNTQYTIRPGISDRFVAEGASSGQATGGAFVGDSVMYGNAATFYTSQDTYTCAGQFTEITGATHTSRNIAALGGLHIEGAFWKADYVAQIQKPEVCFLSVGYNNVNPDNGMQPADSTPESLAESIRRVMQKIEDRGMIPVWLGIGSGEGSPPQNATIDEVNLQVGAICASNDWLHETYLDVMRRNPDWETVYYNNLANDPHPNNDGHRLIAEVAADQYELAQTTVGSPAPSDGNNSGDSGDSGGGGGGGCTAGAAGTLGAEWLLAAAALLLTRMRR